MVLPPSTELEKLESVVANFLREPFNQLRLSFGAAKAGSYFCEGSLEEWQGSEKQKILQRFSLPSSSFASVHVHVHVVVVVIVVVIVIVVIGVADVDVADVSEASTEERKEKGLKQYVKNGKWENIQMNSVDV